jgi:hypothetical protein
VTREVADTELTCDLVCQHLGEWHYQPPDRPGSDRGEQGLWLQMLRNALAPDQGQGRADSLLAILGVGPDYVRQHIAALDTALGPFSPGVSGLHELIRKAEEAVPTSRPTVTRQHMISQVVLRRFAGPVPSVGRLLARFDLATGQVTLADSEDVGYVENFVPVDSQATEDLWQTVEGWLRPAMTSGLNGTAFGSLVHLNTLRQAVALHDVRNPQTLIVHNQSYADALRNGIDRMAKSPYAAHAFEQKYQIAAAGPEALRLGAEAIYDRLIKLHDEGGLFRLSVQRLFEKLCDRFDAKGIQILTPASRNTEFLLGDLPTITINLTSGEAGPGVPVDQADEIVMPLTPRLLVSVGLPDGARSISDDEVDSYNALQVRLAREYLIHRPAATFTAADFTSWRN